MDNNFTYGDLVLISDALERLPKTYKVIYKEGPIKFKPVTVTEIKNKLILIADQIMRDGDNHK